MKEQIYQVPGMHCASCELLIEKKLLEIKGVKAVEASVTDGNVRIEYQGEKPTPKTLNKIFSEQGYTFTENSSTILTIKRSSLTKTATTVILVSIFVVLFLIFTRSDLLAQVTVTSKSSLSGFFLFGLLAGMSSCAALVGGIILSMAKQWSQTYSSNSSSFTRLQPHLLFNLGRLTSYAALGGALGAVGSTLKVSPIVSAIIVGAVSVIMVFLALQMLGVKAFRRFQITMPKSFTRYVADERNFKHRYMPLLMGALTFFLPCGFTLTAQGLAIISGSAAQGALIMLSFALGTLPILLIIGVSSSEFMRRPHFSNTFLKIAGFLVLFFALYNINAQLNVLGFTSLNDLGTRPSIEDGFAPLVQGKQLLKMKALSYSYEPDYFKIKAGIPVRWEITAQNVSGCTNAVISQGLFDGQIDLVSGQTSIKEFTPSKPGRYKFSCWMGMVSGVIDVVGDDGELPNSVDSNFSSGASGCSSEGGSCNGNCGGGCGNPSCTSAR